jgi:hypothetical protein
MRSLRLLSAILFLSLTNGQAQPVTEPAGYPYPSGYTKTTTRSTDESQNRITIVEYKDITGQTRVRETYTATADGKFRLIEEKMEQSTGHITEKVIIELDKDKKLQSQQCIFYPYGEEHARSVHERTPEGGLYPRGRERKNDDDPNYTKPSTVKEWEENYQKKFKAIEGTGSPSSDPIKSACSESPGNCRSKGELFAGYSFLSGDYGNRRENFPVGVRVAAVKYLNNHIAVGVDASLNSRKFGSERLSRSFILIEGKYVLGDMDDCDRKLFGNVRLLGGIGIEKFGSSGGSGPAFGAGAGVIHLITRDRNIGVRAQVDYLAVKYKDVDGLNKNVRISAGVIFRL